MRGSRAISATVHRLHDFPGMSVLELAIASAIGRQQLDDDRQLLLLLADWFQRPVSVTDVGSALHRMEHQGWVRVGGVRLVDYTLTPAGIDVVTTLYGGCIRMIDRGLGLLKVSTLLSLLDLPKEPDNG